jgi:hypothetical protein
MLSDEKEVFLLPSGDPTAPPWRFTVHALDADIPAEPGVYALARMFPEGSGVAFDIETVWPTEDLSKRVEPDDPCNVLLVMVEADAEKRKAVAADIFQTYEPAGDT